MPDGRIDEIFSDKISADTRAKADAQAVAKATAHVGALAAVELALKAGGGKAAAASKHDPAAAAAPQLEHHKKADKWRNNNASKFGGSRKTLGGFRRMAGN